MTDSKWIALTTNRRDKKSGEEIFDLFDTCGQTSTYEWRFVGRVVRSDAVRILRGVNAERFEEGDLR